MLLLAAFKRIIYQISKFFRQNDQVISLQALTMVSCKLRCPSVKNSKRRARRKLLSKKPSTSILTSMLLPEG